MPIDERSISLPEQWAKDAQTVIPAPPVPGIAYRNTAITPEQWAHGQDYSRVADSAQWNQMFWTMSGLLKFAEQYGIMPYSPFTDYPEFGICMGTDGVLYQALQASGPNNGGAQPTNNTAFWKHAVSQQQMDPIGGIRFFEDEMPRPGYVECNAGVVSNFAATYPQMAAYLETPWGQSRLVSSLAEYEALHTAIWHTNADGTTVGWQGIGGVAKFYWDKAADTLKMPDLQDMFQGAAGASLGVGGVDGDRGRLIAGEYVARSDTGVIGDDASFRSGAFCQSSALKGYQPYGQNGTAYGLRIDSSRVVPTGPANAPRRWGALACCYLGTPR